MIALKKVFFIGGAGANNLGDEALLLSAVQKAKAKYSDFETVVATPNHEITNTTLAHYIIKTVEAPRLCIFRIDLDSSYYEGNELFFERYFETRKFLLNNKPQDIPHLIQRKRCPSFFRSESEEFFREMMESDRVILHGGGFLTSMTRSRLWENSLLLLFLKHANKQVVIRSQQLVPILKRDDAERMLDVISSVDQLSVRDVNFSKPEAEKFGRETKIFEIPDDALDVRLDKIIPHAFITAQPFIAVCYRDNPSVDIPIEFFESFSKICVVASRLFDLPIKFIPMIPGDVLPLSRINEKVSEQVRTLGVSSHRWSAIAEIRAANFLISTPHHPLIFALSSAVPVISPVIGDYYGMKNIGSMRHFGLDHFVIEHKGDENLFLNRVESALKALKGWDRVSFREKLRSMKNDHDILDAVLWS